MRLRLCRYLHWQGKGLAGAEGCAVVVTVAAVSRRCAWGDESPRVDVDPRRGSPYDTQLKG